MRDPNVQAFIDDLHLLTPELCELVLDLRALIAELAPSLEESIKYGGLVYLDSGLLLMGIFAYKQHVSLEIGEGAKLDDPAAVLEGKGKHRRHIKFHSLDDVKQKHAAEYIQRVLAKHGQI